MNLQGLKDEVVELVWVPSTAAAAIGGSAASLDKANEFPAEDILLSSAGHNHPSWCRDAHIGCAK